MIVADTMTIGMTRAEDAVMIAAIIAAIIETGACIALTAT